MYLSFDVTRFLINDQDTKIFSFLYHVQRLVRRNSNIRTAASPGRNTQAKDEHHFLFNIYGVGQFSFPKDFGKECSVVFMAMMKQ